jgi:FKBP-type peptidyl-prolyl cis-trans isomerase 2
MTAVVRGDLVRVHYTTWSADDCVMETSAMRDPLEFIAGGNEVIAGISSAVIGMKPGEKKRIRVPPEQGFGERDPRLQQLVPRLAIPDRMSEGDQLTATISGQPLHVWIRAFHEDEVSLDANHPLAGETLAIDLELVGIGKNDAQAAPGDWIWETAT